MKVKLLGQCLAFVSESIGRDALYGRGETVSLTVDRSTAPKPGMWVGGGSVTVVGSPVLTNGVFHVFFQGTSNLTYAIDRASNVSGPWELAFTNVTADALGHFELIDSENAGLAARFYRTRLP